MRMNLVPLAAKFAKTHASEIFRVACLHSHKNWGHKQMMVEYKLQTARGYFDEFVQDTCIDILSKRIPLWVNTPEGEMWIVKPLNHLLPSEKWKDGVEEPWQSDDW